MNNRLIKSNDAGGGGACTNTVDLYNPFPDGGGVALYQLNGDATDVSGNYNGTATNVTYGAGQFGQAGVFNGSSSYINTNLSLPFNSVKTISMWFKANSLQNSVLFEAGPNIPYYGYSLVTVNDGRFYFIINNSNHSGFIGDYTTGATYTANTWYNVVSTQTGSVQKTYLNGVEIGTVSYSTTSESYPIYLAGGSPSGFSGLFNGSIDQVRIFSRALRPYEVEALYTEEYCTPTIVPSEHFNTVTYTGNGTTLPITGVGFQPDLVWIKGRTLGSNHQLTDVVRTAPNSLMTNRTDAEASRGVSSFDSDGFTLQVWPNENGDSNTSGDNYVAWNFKAGGAAVTNTDGTITSQVSANTEAGFSVVSYTTQSSGTATVGHGLNTEPNIVLVKTRGVADSWRMYHSSLGSGSQIYLNLTNAAGSTANQWNNTAPTSSVFSLGTDNAGSYTTIAYCFAEVEGFSNFGSYVGNGASGNTIVTGFEPAFVMIKWTSGSPGNWQMMDNKRGADRQLYANLSNAEGPLYDGVDFLENGFQLKTSYVEFNGNGNNYIYMAFAADPTAVEPTLEDSFNTNTWNGGTPQSINAGFEPDLIWIKSRGVANNHILADTVRGIDGILYSNLTNAEASRLNSIETTATGYNLLDTWAGRNDAAYNGYVGWSWKGAEIPAINSNGSIPSVVSANPAAGFSIVSFNGSTGSWTAGHGLNDAPKMVIYKNRDISNAWAVWVEGFTDKDTLYLNLTNAKTSAGFTLHGSIPTSTTIGCSSWLANSGDRIIAYCFAEVAGFSKFGSYVGTGSAGNAQTLGFEPAFVMIKRSSAASNWSMFDNKRSPTNPRNNWLAANAVEAEQDLSIYDNVISFTTNGFTLLEDGTEFNGNTNFNLSGSTYIYMAFANQF